ncbi:MAG: hypothetical protein NZ928_05870 [Endomicrobia bacterium]|nr:hypothetical protein [Endomicrobiia bacterium]MCX7941133.1 hypothetical protein [Endomicrobiia bacterium]MDW8055279.1 hypothetical protein [Elusimicrobiota bacterium]
MQKQYSTVDVFLKSLIYKFKTYQNLINITIKHLLGKTFYRKDKDYYGYIGESKQLYCKHSKISRLSSTKFYCSDCGKILHFVPEEITIISELIGIFLVASIVYLLTKKKN